MGLKLGEKMKKIFDIYKHNEGCRFALGNKTSNPLFCIGINPSIATDEKTDKTICKVQAIIKFNGYDGLIMLNLFPLISSDPSKLPIKINEDYHRQNLKHIEEVFSLYKQKNILACWGDNISSRKYLWKALQDIYKLSNKANWLHLGSLTKQRNPRHPLYLKIEKLKKFDMQSYLQAKIK